MDVTYLVGENLGNGGNSAELGAPVSARRFRGPHVFGGDECRWKCRSGTEIYGNWDDGTAQKAAANALASGASFDAVWSQGGDTGILRAFEQAGQEMPPIAGEAGNGYRKAAKDKGFPILSIGQSPALSALSIKVALAILQGEKVPRKVSAPLPAVTNDELESGKNFFPDQPDSLFTAINIPICGLNFDIDKVLNQKI